MTPVILETGKLNWSGDNPAWQEELKAEAREFFDPYDLPKVSDYVEELIDKALAKQKAAAIELVEHANATVWQPVGGLSNIEWIDQEAIVTRLKKEL